jgi:phthiocerol/phenolphthiocerol synthesis type-I polyketide synthase D
VTSNSLSEIHKNDRRITFGLIFFASSEAPQSGDRYRLVMESAKFADQHGFSSVWIPERHFTKEGWLYPNPAVLQAAIARETKQIGLRAGSVVIPLHNPIRVAEEWAMVDNLSGGRVGLSFASGWHPNDFALAPENYANRNEIMYQQIEVVRKLWRGEPLQVKGGDGKLVEIHAYPTPIQPELPIWVTAAGNPKTFAGAGEIGANLLTHMYNQSVEELAEKIRIYRDSRAKHGYDPETGQVSVMLHTFVGADLKTVREQVQDPFCNYLKGASHLFNAIAYSRGQKVDLASLSEQDFNDYLNFVLDRLMSTERVLFGTPESCLNLVGQLQKAGVNEIACQLDFGLDVDLALDSMVYLNQLKERADAEISPNQSSTPWMHERTTSIVYHVNGNAPAHEPVSSAQSEQPGNRLEEARQRCREDVDVSAFYNRLYERGIQLSSSFQGIEQLWRRDGEALGRVSLPADFESDAAAYQVHPTLLDACFQVLIAALPDALFRDDGALYLPTGLRSFQLHQQPGKQVWSHAVLTTRPEQANGLFEGDVLILDAHGQVLIEAQGMQLQSSLPAAPPVSPASTPVKTTTAQQNELAEWLYELHWEPVAAELSKRLPIERAGKWLLFTDSAGVGYRLAEMLMNQRATCFEVVPGKRFQVLGHRQYQIDPGNPEDMRRVIRLVQAADAEPLCGVVHLWSLDATPVARTSATSLVEDQTLSATSALHALQAVVHAGGNEPPRVWLVTQGAQAVTTDAAALAVAQSPLWGLGRTCAMEHPELWGGLIDLDPQEAVDDAASQLFGVLADQSGEDQTAFRQGERYVARMVHSQNWTQQQLTLRPDASYLITGGFWGLGFEVARWLAQKGARHLVLMGRTNVPPRDQWDSVAPGSRLARLIAGIRELEQSGTRVHCATVDVTDEHDLRAFLQDFTRQGHPPIRGVMHAASVWQDAQGQSLVRPLANLDVTALEEVFRPKVVGSWLLHSLLRSTNLDFFVSFSSGASLFGSAAQGNYAAAGAFLDALAHYQRTQGVPAISIDWGAISEIGFGATPEGLRVHEYWESHGIQRITPRHVLVALDLLIPQQLAQVGVIKLDWQLLQQFYPQIAGLPLVTHLVAAPADGSAGVTATIAAGNEIIPQILAAEPSTRLSVLEAYLCEQVGAVLRVPASRLDIEQPLTTLGLDSLMAIELKNRIELALKVRIPIVTFLQGPSIAQFAGQVLEQILAMAEAVPVTVSAETILESQNQANAHDEKVAVISQRDAEQLLAQVDQLSDEEVNALLSQMMQEEHSHTGNGHKDGEDRSHKEGTTNGISPQEAARLLAQLDQLSDEHVDSLLSQIVQEEE